MKRIISYMLMLVAFVAFSTPTFAQNNTKQRKTREQMVEAQAQHIAKTMAFDDATSTRFVKTFCEYQKEVWALGPRQRPQRKNGQSQSEADAEKAMKERFAHSQKFSTCVRSIMESTVSSLRRSKFSVFTNLSVNDAAPLKAA